MHCHLSQFTYFSQNDFRFLRKQVLSLEKPLLWLSKPEDIRKEEADSITKSDFSHVEIVFLCISRDLDLIEPGVTKLPAK